MNSRVFYDVRPYISAHRYQHFTETCCHLQRRKDSHTYNLKRRWHVPLRRKHISAKQHGVTSQETVTFRMTFHYHQGTIFPKLDHRLMSEFRLWKTDSSVNVVTGLRTGRLNFTPDKDSDFSPRQCSGCGHSSGTHSTCYSMDTFGSVAGSKAVQSEADHSPLSSAELREVRAATDCRHSSW